MRLFVYGIFLDPVNQANFGMTHPEYDTVRDYATYGHGIVTAYHNPGKGLSLAGLIVLVPKDQWAKLDKLERGYDRVTVETTGGVETFMYVGGNNGQTK